MTEPRQVAVRLTREQATYLAKSLSEAIAYVSISVQEDRRYGHLDDAEAGEDKADLWRALLAKVERVSMQAWGATWRD